VGVVVVADVGGVGLLVVAAVAVAVGFQLCWDANSAVAVVAAAGAGDSVIGAMVARLGGDDE
jgi:fructose-1-phosphate kinase PfkB-like protein